MTSWLWSILGLLAAAFLIALIFVLPPESAWQSVFTRIERLGLWVAIVLIGMMILHNVVPVPAELIAVTAGATLGLTVGVLVVWIGAMLGAILAFWVARRFGRKLLQGNKLAAQLERFDRMVARGDWQGMVAVRLIPIISFNLINYAAGLSGVGWPVFLWTTAIGILPITMLSVAAGTGIQVLGLGTGLAIIGTLVIGVIAVRVLWRSKL